MLIKLFQQHFCSTSRLGTQCLGKQRAHTSPQGVGTGTSSVLGLADRELGAAGRCLARGWACLAVPHRGRSGCTRALLGLGGAANDRAHVRDGCDLDASSGSAAAAPLQTLLWIHRGNGFHGKRCQALAQVPREGVESESLKCSKHVDVALGGPVVNAVAVLAEGDDGG